MAKNFAQRLDKLERLAEELLSRTVAHRNLPFDPDYTAEDYERIRHEMLDEMVAAGEIVEGQQERVRFTRWMTKDEDAAMGCRRYESLFRLIDPEHNRWIPNNVPRAPSFGIDQQTRPLRRVRPH
jgi:hypothetical protein